MQTARAWSRAESASDRRYIRYASNNCVTCHVYHDRAKETTPMKGRTLEELLGKHKQVAAAK